MSIQEEVDEIVFNARAAWKAGEISTDDMNDICIRAMQSALLSKTNEDQP